MASEIKVSRSGVLLRKRGRKPKQCMACGYLTTPGGSILGEKAPASINLFLQD